MTTASAENPHQEYAATQLPAEVDKPVQWVKQVTVQNMYDQAVSELTVSIPEQAMNVAASEVGDGSPVDVKIDDSQAVLTDSLDFNEQKTYILRYETPSPEKEETGFARKGSYISKNVIVSSEFHYEDVYTYTTIPETAVTDRDKVRLYWITDGTRKDVTNDPDIAFRLQDTNGNGKYDQISWVAPHLSTQIFEVIIYSSVDAGNYSSIGLSLIAPSDGEYITTSGRIGFNYSVKYNSSTAVYCNLTVDGIVRRENVPTLANTEITTYFNLSSGAHNWNVRCAGSDGAVNTSTTRSFTIDLDNPVVTLNIPDYHVSNTSSVSLNFTPVDEKYPFMVCGLSLNGAVNRTNIVASNNTVQSIAFTGLSNGVYKWNASCTDGAGNRGSSEERIFYVSVGTPSEYSITTNKASYSLGEAGYMIINAKSGSNLTLFVDKPLHDSYFAYYNGKTFPIVESINFTTNSGTYNLDGIFMNAGNMYVVKLSFDVTSSFSASIEANETTGVPGTEFEFEANATGGIGTVTYTWDFGDGGTSNGTTVRHNYTATGSYDAELTATDSKGNAAKETINIEIFRKHNLQVFVKEKQTGRALSNVPVEVDDERKSTNAYGNANFTVYEGKRRVYVALDGYAWFKEVHNITEDTVLTVELNNTGEANYTAIDDAVSANVTTEAETAAGNSAEELLAQISAAIESLTATDEATKAALSALSVEPRLQAARKELRQIIRDLGNAEIKANMTHEQKNAMIGNITKNIDSYRSLISSVEVEDTTEYSETPKPSDITLLSEEYLRYRKINYTKKEKEAYLAANNALQQKATIKTRVAAVKLTLLSGAESSAGLVINTISGAINDSSKAAILEYLPKEVAASTRDIKSPTEFETVKSDPIIKFKGDTKEYAYYVNSDLSVESLKKTRRALIAEPTPSGQKGLPGVTGFSILNLLRIKDAKLAAEIAIIAILLLAYVTYHFELVDRIKEARKKKKEMYTPDSSYGHESIASNIATDIKSFLRKEDEAITKELSHIKTLIMTAHSHADAKRHDDAHAAYRKIAEHYRGLSPEAKSEIHEDTRIVYNKVLISKIDNLLDEAFEHINARRHAKAGRAYSEVKGLYSQLEKEHRAAVSERCMKLHEKLFESSLT